MRKGLRQGISCQFLDTNLGQLSIKHYSRTGESKKRMIAETISNKILGNPTAKKSKEEPKGKTGNQSTYEHMFTIVLISGDLLVI